MQSAGVFVDTMVVCTTTALIILVSGLYDPANPTAIVGAGLTQAAVAGTFGTAGQWFMTVMVFAFAFSSVLGNYAYADANLSFLHANPRMFLAFRLVALLAVLAGSVTALPLVWALADVAMGLMALVNIAALLLLWPWARAVLADYENSPNSTPAFVARDCANLPRPRTDLVW